MVSLQCHLTVLTLRCPGDALILVGRSRSEPCFLLPWFSEDRRALERRWLMYNSRPRCSGVSELH